MNPFLYHNQEKPGSFQIVKHVRSKCYYVTHVNHNGLYYTLHVSKIADPDLNPTHSRFNYAEPHNFDLTTLQWFDWLKDHPR